MLTCEALLCSGEVLDGIEIRYIYGYGVTWYMGYSILKTSKMAPTQVFMGSLLIDSKAATVIYLQ